uniref:Uncharacterized protein n=1 Tax=viral metagenome TaxID=1070528 RepID=A0A6M3X4R9_9ZZZZ
MVFTINKRRIKITTNADFELKELFISFHTFHNKGFHDALDIGMRLILKEINKIDYMDYEIRELDNKKGQLIALKEKFKDIDPILTKVEREKLSGEEELEKERLEALKSLLKKPYSSWTAPNRSHAKAVGKFKTKEELKKWVTEKQ